MAIALKYIDEGFRSLSVRRPLLIGLPERSSIPYISVVVVVLYFSGRRCRQQRVASQLASTMHINTADALSLLSPRPASLCPECATPRERERERAL